MEDQIAASQMALKAYFQLKKIKPDHELVKLMEPTTSDEEFTERFWKKEKPPTEFPGSMVSMILESNYFLEVQKVLKEEYQLEI